MVAFAQSLYSSHSVTVSRIAPTRTKDLKPPEMGAAFSFCNIWAAWTSPWGHGIDPLCESPSLVDSMVLDWHLTRHAL